MNEQKIFNINDATKSDYDDRLLCPDCIGHKQCLPSEVCNCNNLFVDDERVFVGVCYCFSKIHGEICHSCGAVL